MTDTPNARAEASKVTAELADAQARIEELEDKIQNAAQAAAETSPNWESRCYAILAALGMDFGDYSEEVPDVGSWFEVTNRKNLARIEELEAKLAEVTAMLPRAYRLALEDAADRLEPKNPVHDWTDFARQHHADAVEIRTTPLPTSAELLAQLKEKNDE